MKYKIIVLILLVSNLWNLPVYSQTKDEPVSLGLPGDNLDLYAVMEIFQKSKTIEDFEKSLNDNKTGVNNLDLDNDKKVDFIKVITNKEDDSFNFVLQVAVSKTENQDLAVILVSKDDNDKVVIQIVGDEALYGENYVIEPKESSSGSTKNPGYNGGGNEMMSLPAAQEPKTTVVVQTAPIVQYVYSPFYVPYYPPYYYGFYPPYFRPWVPLMFSVYWSHHFYCHRGYYGGYRGSVNINIYNSRNYNNYSSRYRRTSNSVYQRNKRGDYKSTYQGRDYARPSNRPSTSPSTRPSSPSTRPTSPSTRPTSPSTRPTSPSTRPTSPSTRPASPSTTRPATRPTSPSTTPSTRPATRPSSPSTRPTSPSTRPLTRPSSSSSFSRPSSGSSFSRGGYSGGGGYSGAGRGVRR